MAAVVPENQLIIRHWHTGLDLTALQASNPARYPFLLASTSEGSNDANRTNSTDRYDLLMAFPQSRLELWPTGLRLDGQAISAPDFLSALDDQWHQAAEYKTTSATDLPFSGGWFLYLGYELAAEIEPTLNLPIDEHSALPIATAVRIPLAIIHDRYTQTISLLCETEYASLLDDLILDIQNLDPMSGHDDDIHLSMLEEDAGKFLKGVEKVKQYIHEGDVFQVNLSRRWQAQIDDNLSYQAIFRQLSKSNPAPFAGLACFKNAAIISSSPERLVRVRQNRVETRPIAGTRPRGSNHAHDQLNLQELIGHPKERAEHVMLIDLERNDLGRVCQPGSVEVNELMVLESYAHVHHIVSNVRGELRAGCSPAEVIRAVFPGGTITGCPKVRCMEIIAELEQAARGAYTGAMGYLNHNGDMDLNILIRSLVIDRNTMAFRAGAGLVADSIAPHELDETRAKAKGLLLSLQQRVLEC